MGVGAKPFGKLRGDLQKIENERLKEQKILNHSGGKKEKKENKKS